ncbi:putative Zinc finger protein [Trachipleistophora hominis]|uniref:Putative Zinc finger protein n=1 Tax=Trachipleistophora hominis TaxID=72359 RepID=L7JU91_TRAHO|nr:putative Zinc finger protein [Trachipleistophora hominis]
MVRKQMSSQVLNDDSSDTSEKDIVSMSQQTQDDDSSMESIVEVVLSLEESDCREAERQARERVREKAEKEAEARRKRIERDIQMGRIPPEKDLRPCRLVANENRPHESPPIICADVQRNSIWEAVYVPVDRENNNDDDDDSDDTRKKSPDILQKKQKKVGNTVLDKISVVPQIVPEENAICSICFEKIKGMMYNLKCKHTFHMDCIFRWVYTCNLCPLCKCPILLGIYNGRK